mmetsp:Transcript_48225/g.114907  ORF Transcript_48225/g.114907 Transcript_48225/m.114907 type:complete len:276 (-) Transcript_48225:365-1192(-)
MGGGKHKRTGWTLRLSVGACVHAVLRWRISWRADCCTRNLVAEAGVGHALLAKAIGAQLREAEVEDLQRPGLLGDQDVRRLHIPMDNARFMKICQALHQLAEELRSRAHASLQQFRPQLRIGQPISKCDAIAVFHLYDQNHVVMLLGASGPLPSRLRVRIWLGGRRRGRFLLKLLFFIDHPFEAAGALKTTRQAHRRDWCHGISYRLQSSSTSTARRHQRRAPAAWEVLGKLRPPPGVTNNLRTSQLLQLLKNFEPAPTRVVVIHGFRGSELQGN